MISTKGVAMMAVVAAMVLVAAGPAQAEDWSPLWTTATLSQGRYELAAVSADDKVFFGGGNTGHDDSNVVDIYDTASGTWSNAARRIKAAGEVAARRSDFFSCLGDGG